MVRQNKSLKAKTVELSRVADKWSVSLCWFLSLVTGCTYVEDMGRLESPHLIERDRLILILKTQVELLGVADKWSVFLSVIALKNVWIAQKQEER